jgi:hypothetical protein
MWSLLIPPDCFWNIAFRKATRLVFHVGMLLLLLVLAGCSSKPRPGVTCNVSIITQAGDGTFTPQGSVTKIESAAAGTVTEITHEGGSLSLLVRKTEYGKATLDLTFPGLEPVRVKINAGEMKNVLPNGQKIGVRIEVQDCH